MRFRSSFFKTIIVNGDDNSRIDRLTTIIVNLVVNYRQLKEDFVFALIKCSSAAFGEQNKTDNDSKRLQFRG